MNEDDLSLRNLTYGRFAQLGRAPAPAEIAAPGGRSRAEVIAGWERLHAEHALVLNQVTGQKIMANPFSAVPTAYHVQAARRWWYGNCAWDAFGICAALQADGRIETTSCQDCGDALRIAVRDQRPDDRSLSFHCLVPAARWWDDIVFT